MGNLWEWGEGYFCALEGFKTHNLYNDFSTPYFDGLHSMEMGGSFISSGNQISYFARYGFRSHFY